jgi:predicted ATP-grasp superfamily ATP-dependent carboligase
VSALLGLGRAIRDALATDLRALGGIEVSIASGRPGAEAPANGTNRTNGTIGTSDTTGNGTAGEHCSPAPGECMADFVERVAAKHDYVWGVAPECGGLLARLHDAVGPARWLGCERAAIVGASSKRGTAARLAARGMAATPALGVAGSDALGKRGDGGAATRWVVKPDDGAGGLDTLVFGRFSDACAHYAERVAAQRNPVLQAWVDGEPLSLTLMCGGDDTRLLSVNRQQISLDPGGDGSASVRFEGVAVNQIAPGGARGRVLEALACQVAAVFPGLFGIVGIDLVWHPWRGPVVIEVNPRPTFAYVGLSASLGRNLAGELLRLRGMRAGAPGTARQITR